MGMQTGFSRRVFLRGAALAVGAAALKGCTYTRSVGETVRLGVIGVGGRGMGNWPAMVDCGGVRIAAMCDVDSTFLDAAKKWYADKGLKADFTTYADYRKMLETEKGLDAVVVSTPDHTHARAAIQAMKLGCHVYVEKPLVRTVWEDRKSVV